MYVSLSLAELLLQNRSSFLHGRKPAGDVPIYALVKNCLHDNDDNAWMINNNVLIDDFVNHVDTNNLPGECCFFYSFLSRLIARKKNTQ